jgi:hypothetical protein
VKFHRTVPPDVRDNIGVVQANSMDEHMATSLPEYPKKVENGGISSFFSVANGFEMAYTVKR